MADIRTIIEGLASGEQGLRASSFLSPSLPNGKVRTAIGGIIYEFVPTPSDFEGWGIFHPRSARQAELAEEASLPLIDRYLRLLPLVRMRLVAPIGGRTWLAFPVNASDVQARLGEARPMPVHLVEGGIGFERIVARWDGTALWFQEEDRRADPLIAERLREGLRAEGHPDKLRIKGMTPEDRIAYELLWNRTALSRAEQTRRRNEERLRGALEGSGGWLEDFRERGETFVVNWKTADGEAHSSVISQNDLTVVGAGICLSGADREFDLQSLVGVIEERPDWMR